MIKTFSVSHGVKRGALSCVWIETGNPLRPLACVWINHALRIVGRIEDKQSQEYPLCA